jgi:hypothetical protein
MIQGWLRTAFEMCGSSASLIVTAKPKAKEHFRIAGVLLFYILQNISVSFIYLFIYFEIRGSGVGVSWYRKVVIPVFVIIGEVVKKLTLGDIQKQTVC